MRRFSPFLVAASACVLLAFDLNSDELKMLQDSGGWEYINLSRNETNGFPTQHTCFDGKPHPGECSGTLLLTSGKTFSQSVRIQGKTVRRTGTYQLNGDQLSFFDELGTQDGPYTLALNTQAKSLVLQMPQARIELLLESEYRKNMEEQRKKGSAH
jgi:hypothetical protein